MSEPGSWHQVCREGEVSDGAVVAVQAQGKDLAVARVGADLFCVDAICSHAFGFLDEGTVIGYEIECPLHGGRFDLRTGEPTRLPPVDPIATYPLRIEGGAVYVDIAS